MKRFVDNIQIDEFRFEDVLLERLKHRFHDKFFFGGSIPRRSLYQFLACSFRFNKQISRRALKSLSMTFPFLHFGKRGLKIEPVGDKNG